MIEGILFAIFVVLLFINNNLSILIKSYNKESSQPSADQINKLIEQIGYMKWNTEAILNHLKHGLSEEEKMLKDDALWYKQFKDNS